MILARLCNRPTGHFIQANETKIQEERPCLLPVSYTHLISSGECTPDGRFSLEACRCVGACGLAPVMTVNDEVYGRLVPDDIDGIIADYQNR